METAVELLLKYGQDCQVILSVTFTVFGILTAFLPALRRHRAKVILIICGQGLLLMIIAIALQHAKWLTDIVLKDAVKLSQNEKLQILLAADEAAQKQAATELFNEELKVRLEEGRKANKEQVDEGIAARRAAHDQVRALKNVVGAWAVEGDNAHRETVRFNQDGSCTAYFWDGHPSKNGHYSVESPQLISVTWDGDLPIKYFSNLIGTGQYIEFTDRGNLHANKEQG